MCKRIFSLGFLFTKLGEANSEWHGLMMLVELRSSRSFGSMGYGGMETTFSFSSGILN
ncbi:hypothetical protein M153_28045000234 [Pseudoloma neurophilia]|uniref:Uncharacterized protein n=1 Tax=Pseudoloma neurophilia TaxID=146866 RepID=A0A0R0LYH8_9MICR|nr:hypothetical protein M153_28045000234 [Pseudoloma neurophilia]